MQEKTRELMVLGLVFAGPVLFIAGTLMLTLGISPGAGLWLGVVGLLAQLSSTRITASLETVHAVGAKKSGGRDYDMQRRISGLRTASLLLNLLGAFAIISLVIAIWTRASGDTLGETSVVTRIVSIMNTVIAVSWLLAHYQSLRTPVERSRNWIADLFMQASLVFTIFAILAVILVSFRDLEMFGRTLLSFYDAPVLLLAGQTGLVVALFLARQLPNFYSIFTVDKGPAGRGTASKARTVLLPTLAAFGLLFMLILVILAYGIGFADVIGEIAGNPTVLGLLGFLLMILVGVVVLAVRIGASADQKPPLITQKLNEEEKKENLLVLISGLAAVFVVGFAVMLRQGIIPNLPTDRWFDVVGAGVLIAIGPYGFYIAAKHKRIRNMEDRFPDFLRDLASSHKGGLTLYSSVTVAARGDYGTLSPEVNKMADQLSWHVPFEEALERFGERVHTPLVQRSVNLILEASRSGGSTTDVLMAAARDAREIKNLETDRSLNMSVYTIVVYVTFFVFLLVASILYSEFIPAILAASSDANADGGAAVQGVSFVNNLKLDDYRVFYFTASIVQGIGDGIIAGMMGAGRASMGLRHSFWMVLIAWMTFVFFI